MTVKKLIKLIEDDGWYHIKTKGSHRQFIMKYKNIYTLMAGESKPINWTVL